MRAAFRRVPVAAPARQRAQHKGFAPPIRGWIESEPAGSAKPAGATMLENWRPTQRGIQLRGGLYRVATLPSEVRAMFTYETSGVLKHFAATTTAIYRVDNLVDPLVTPAADVTGQTGGNYASAMFTNAGITVLFVVNGIDDPLIYDGSAWSAPPAITGVDPTTLSHVWSHNSRLYFVEENSLNAWFLDVDAIGGAAQQVSLSGVFRKGGKLLFGGTVSTDAGNGPNAYCVFVTDRGEMAMYVGSNPADANDWQIAGVFDIGAPLGKLAHIREAGDMIIATERGFIRALDVFKTDAALLSSIAISRNIEQTWKDEVVARQHGNAWTCVKWDAKGIAIIGLPNVGELDDYCFVVSLQTGAWAKYTGWHCVASCIYDGAAYIGGSNGAVYQCERSGSDDGTSYACAYVGLFEHIGGVGPTTVARMARATFLASKPFNPIMGVSTNYTVTLQAYADAAQSSPTEGWDEDLWDTGVWDANSSVKSMATSWVSVRGVGFTMAPVIQVMCGSEDTPDAELVSYELQYERGAIVV